MKKVWTYLSNRALTNSEIESLNQSATAFVKQWTAHENKLAADFSIYKNRILVFTVNEEVYGASGCSIDKLLRFVKETEAKFKIELLNRMLTAIKINDELAVVNVSELKQLLSEKKITADSIVYNTSVSNDKELLDWAQPLKNTWLKKYLEV